LNAVVHTCPTGLKRRAKEARKRSRTKLGQRTQQLKGRFRLWKFRGVDGEFVTVVIVVVRFRPIFVAVLIRCRSGSSS
jgi:hypothetical protein